MKYAFMSFSCPELTLGEMLALARRLGYNGIEPRLSSGHRHNIETTLDADARRTARRQIEDSGIALCCLATGARLADPATARDNIESVRQAIALAGDLGCDRLRVFGGALATGLSRAAAIEVLARNLAALADEAAAAGVTLCLETHDDWTDPAHVAAVMRWAGHPAAAINWDIMHPVRQSGYTMDAAYDILKPWIRHVHFHDGIDVAGELQLRPVGAGVIDHRRAVQLLRAAGYDGYLSGEWIDWEPCEVHLPRELATMRVYENEPAPSAG
jgi:sugar phosphate isomerase/epimerase